MSLREEAWDCMGTVKDSVDIDIYNPVATYIQHLEAKIKRLKRTSHQIMLDTEELEKLIFQTRSDDNA